MLLDPAGGVVFWTCGDEGSDNAPKFMPVVFDPITMSCIRSDLKQIVFRANRPV